MSKNKVDIIGINTNELIVLSNEEMEDLLTIIIGVLIALVIFCICG